jgi:hypothetical protein
MSEIKGEKRKELTLLFEKLIGKMSYYNAAEGSSYSREGGARSSLKNDLKLTATTMINYGFTREELKLISRGSLTSESDYLSREIIQGRN